MAVLDCLHRACSAPAHSLLALSLLTALISRLDAQPLERAGPRAAGLPPAQVDELDAATAAQLEQSERFLAESQWSEAVEAIRRAESAAGDRLVTVNFTRPAPGFTRYVPAQQYCQWRLAALAAEAPEALAAYRRLVDPLAERWLRSGEEHNDEVLLSRVVDQAFASRHGDEALLKLGDLALARGQPAAARARWSRILPGYTVPLQAASALRAPPGSPLWLALRKFDFSKGAGELREVLENHGPPALGLYPDSDIEPAAVLARLVLASVFEGSRERAAIELQVFRTLYPDAEGEIGGRRGKYVLLLGDLLQESAAWPAIREPADWSTVGGNFARNKSTRRAVDPAGRPLWSYPLPRQSAEREWLGTGRLRPADDAKSLLAYHPLVVQNEVLVQFDARGNSFIVALDLKTGRRLWQVDYSRGIAPDEGEDSQPPLLMSDVHADLGRHVGVSRHTLSASGDKLLARLGSPVTAPGPRRASTWLAKDQGFLMGFDLQAEGKPLEGFPIRPPSSEWTFEGSPLADRGTLYVAMRRVGGAQSQLYLAAFELPTSPLAAAPADEENDRPTGRLKWRTRLCSSQTALGGQLDQLTHLLVTLAEGCVYLNTNAGVVASVNAADGKLLWLVKYPRAPAPAGQPEEAAPHWFRDLTPCLAWKDLLIVAPADCQQIFAVEAATGELAWAMPPDVAADAVHLLGVQNDALMASGDSLYWIDVHTGKLLTQFPRRAPRGPAQAAPAPRGLGRGVISDGHAWWPTRESIFVFAAEPQEADFGYEPKLVREIALLPRDVTGGNLVMAGGVLLIATGDRLVAFGE